MNNARTQIDGLRGRLNAEQARAADDVVGGWDDPNGAFLFPIVEGPPGTGKTTVGVAGVARHVLENPTAQIAYLAFTNLAAEKAREDLYALGLRNGEVLRLDRESRRRDWRNGVIGAASDLHDLLPNDLRRVKQAKVLISTLHASSRVFTVLKQPTIVIDEFSQVSPALFFSTIAKVSRTTDYRPSGFALLGDPNQLPVITTQPLLRPNVGNFIMARKPDYEPHQLEMQYRMNERICGAVNALRDALHTYRLRTAADVRSRNLGDHGFDWNPAAVPDAFREAISPANPVVFVDTDGLPGFEQIGFNQSTYYPQEASLAAALSRYLSRAFQTPAGQALVPTILSPYTAQTSAIQTLLPEPGLRDACLTIYKAQGREYPAVIVSFVRKNQQGRVGFLGEPELRAQTYVACSRAQAKLILLFSYSTFRGNLDHATLIEQCRNQIVEINGRDLWSDEM